MQREPRPFGRPTQSPFPFLLLSFIVFVVLAAAGVYFVTAQAVEIQIGDARVTVRTHQQTVGDVLREAGVTLAPEDQVRPAPAQPIGGIAQIIVSRARSVLIRADGQERRIATRQSDSAAILAEAGVRIGPGDQVETIGDLISVARARTVTVVDGTGGSVAMIMTTATTVADALSAAQVVLYAADTVKPPLDAPLTDRVEITRANPITILADGRTIQTRTQMREVGSALAEAGAALAGLDTSDPAPDSPIRAGLTIRVRRLTETEETESQTIPFTRTLTPDPSLELDTIQVTQPGRDGRLDIFVRVRREDGIVVSRSAPLRWVTQPAQDEQARIGTHIVVRSIDTPDGQFDYWRTLRLKATAYRPSSFGKSPDDPTFGVTSTGQRLARGIIAADPALIPLGTEVYIPGYGRAVMGDVLPGLNGAALQLGFSEAEYQPFDGPVTVYVLAPAPADGSAPPLPAALTR